MLLHSFISLSIEGVTSIKVAFKSNVLENATLSNYLNVFFIFLFP